MHHPRTRALPALALTALAAVLTTLPLSAQGTAREAARSAGVKVVSTADLKAQLTQPSGRVRITVLYGVQCPISQAMFRDLGPLTRRYAPRGVEFFAYNTDVGSKNVAAIPAFLKQYAARVEPRWIEPWKAGSLTEAVGAVGVHIGSTWTRPLVIIQDRTGKLVWSGQAVGDLHGLDGWLEEALR